MAITSSFLIGFIISLWGVISSFLELTDKIKIISNAILMISCTFLLVLNLIHFFLSPNSKRKILLTAFWETIFQDNYGVINKRWSLKGKSVYCNQSLCKARIIDDGQYCTVRGAYFSDIPDSNNFENIDFTSKLDHRFSNTISYMSLQKNYHETGLDNYDSESREFSLSKPEGENWLDSSEEWCLMIKANDLKIRFRKINKERRDAVADFDMDRVDFGQGDFKMCLSYEDTSEVLVVNCLSSTEPNLIINLIYSSYYHSVSPATGVCKRAKTCNSLLWGVYDRLHSYSYQELGSMFRSNNFDTILFRLSHSFKFIVEDNKQDFVLLSYMEKYGVKMGFSNVEKFFDHNKRFWGEINLKAMDYAMNRSCCIDYRSIGPNWRAKRYLVDCSYLRNCMGLHSFSMLQKGIQPSRHVKGIKMDLVNESQFMMQPLRYELPSKSEMEKMKAEIIEKIKKDGYDKNSGTILSAISHLNKKQRPLVVSSKVSSAIKSISSIKPNNAKGVKNPGDESAKEFVKKRIKLSVMKQKESHLEKVKNDFKECETDLALKDIPSLNYKNALLRKLENSRLKEEEKLEDFFNEKVRIINELVCTKKGSVNRKSKTCMRVHNYMPGQSRSFPSEPLSHERYLDAKKLHKSISGRAKRSLRKPLSKNGQAKCVSLPLSNPIDFIPIDIKNTYEVLSSPPEKEEEFVYSKPHEPVLSKVWVRIKKMEFMKIMKERLSKELTKKKIKKLLKELVTARFARPGLLRPIRSKKRQSREDDFYHCPTKKLKLAPKGPWGSKENSKKRKESLRQGIESSKKKLSDTKTYNELKEKKKREMEEKIKMEEKRRIMRMKEKLEREENEKKERLKAEMRMEEKRLKELLIKENQMKIANEIEKLRTKISEKSQIIEEYISNNEIDLFKETSEMEKAVISNLGRDLRGKEFPFHLSENSIIYKQLIDDGDTFDDLFERLMKLEIIDDEYCRPDILAKDSEDREYYINDLREFLHLTVMLEEGI